jgi:hypothetical protein
MKELKGTITLELDAQVSGTYSPGCKGDSGFRRGCIGLQVNPTPDDPPEIEDLCVMVNGWEITEKLSDKQLEEAEQILWEKLEDEQRE